MRQPSRSACICRAAEPRGSPHQLTLSRSSQRSNVVGKNGTPKSSRIWLLQMYQDALIATRRHLDLSTCTFLTWVRAVDLQIRHALSTIGRMSCLYNITPFLMEGPFLLFKRWHNTSTLWAALFFTWSICYHQVSRISRVNPGHREVSTQWTGSTKTWTGRGCGMRLPVVEERIAVLFETLLTTSILSNTPLCRWDMPLGSWRAAMAGGTCLKLSVNPKCSSRRSLHLLTSFRMLASRILSNSLSVVSNRLMGR